MDIKRQAFENLWLAGGGSFDNFIFSEDHGKYITIENSDLTDKQKEMSLYIVNNAYLFFVGGFKQAAKAQAVLEGFVLVPMVPSERMVDAVRKCYEGEAYLPYSLYSEFINQAMIEAQEQQ